MHIKTLLNYVTNFKGFVFQDTQLDRERNRLLIQVVPRKNSKPVCSRCGRPGSTYDHLKKVLKSISLRPVFSSTKLLKSACFDCSPLSSLDFKSLPVVFWILNPLRGIPVHFGKLIFKDNNYEQLNRHRLIVCRNR